MELPASWCTMPKWPKILEPTGSLQGLYPCASSLATADLIGLIRDNRVRVCIGHGWITNLHEMSAATSPHVQNFTPGAFSDSEPIGGFQTQFRALPFTLHRSNLPSLEHVSTANKTAESYFHLTVKVVKLDRRHSTVCCPF